MIRTRFQFWIPDPNGTTDENGDVRDVDAWKEVDLPAFFPRDAGVRIAHVSGEVESITYDPIDEICVVAVDLRFLDSPVSRASLLSNAIADGWSAVIDCGDGGEDGDAWVEDAKAILRHDDAYRVSLDDSPHPGSGQ